MWQTIKGACDTVWNVMFVDPLKRLYLFGPAIMHFGFWGGTPLPEICRQMVGSADTKYWSQAPEECKNLVDQKFYSFYVGVYSGIYVYCLYKFFHWLIQQLKNGCYHLVRQPIIHYYNHPPAPPQFLWPPAPTTYQHPYSQMLVPSPQSYLPPHPFPPWPQPQTSYPKPEYYHQFPDSPQTPKVRPVPTPPPSHSP
jgi:hypothetical protein